MVLVASSGIFSITMMRLMRSPADPERVLGDM
jgi:hypothetical protein